MIDFDGFILMAETKLKPLSFKVPFSVDNHEFIGIRLLSQLIFISPHFLALVVTCASFYFSTSSAKLTNPPKNGRHYHSKNIDPSELKAARERIQTSIMNLAEAVSKNGSKRRVHSKTTDSQVCKDCSERFLNSVLPDELLRQGSPPKNHTTTREKTRRRKPKKNPAPPEPSKLKCCTNCYCITCNNCKHKVKLDESLCSMCKDKAAVSKKLENIPGY